MWFHTAKSLLWKGITRLYYQGNRPEETFPFSTSTLTPPAARTVAGRWLAAEFLPKNCPPRTEGSCLSPAHAKISLHLKMEWCCIYRPISIAPNWNISEGPPQLQSFSWDWRRLVLQMHHSSILLNPLLLLSIPHGCPQESSPTNFMQANPHLKAVFQGM